MFTGMVLHHIHSPGESGGKYFRAVFRILHMTAARKTVLSSGLLAGAAPEFSASRAARVEKSPRQERAFGLHVPGHSCRVFVTCLICCQALLPEDHETDAQVLSLPGISVGRCLVGSWLQPSPHLCGYAAIFLSQACVSQQRAGLSSCISGRPGRLSARL